MGLMSRFNIFIVSYHVVKLVRLTQKEAVHIMHAVDNELTGKTSLTIFVLRKSSPTTKRACLARPACTSVLQHSKLECDSGDLVYRLKRGRCTFTLQYYTESECWRCVRRDIAMSLVAVRPPSATTGQCLK